MRTLVRLAFALVVGASLASCAAPEPAQPPAVESSRTPESDLKSLAQSLGLDDPPAVTLERYVAPNEWADVQIACLTDLGYPVGKTPDGEGIDSSSVPAAQSQKGGPYAVAVYTCSARFPTEAGSSRATEEQLSLLYDWYVDVEVVCLEAHGVDVGEPPSRETFVATYYTPQGWIPYRAVEPLQLPAQELAELEASCPQEPETPLW